MHTRRGSGISSRWRVHRLDTDRISPAQHTFKDTSRILTNATYFDGNATKYDWVVNSGTIINSTAGELGLTLTEDNGGTRISSTRYVHYGTITARRAYLSYVPSFSMLTLATVRQSRRASGAVS